MMHVRRLSCRRPAQAVELPESHTLEFILENFPGTFWEVIRLVHIHAKQWEAPEE